KAVRCPGGPGHGDPGARRQTLHIGDGIFAVRPRPQPTQQLGWLGSAGGGYRGEGRHVLNSRTGVRIRPTCVAPPGVPRRSIAALRVTRWLDARSVRGGREEGLMELSLTTRTVGAHTVVEV